MTISTDREIGRLSAEVASLQREVSAQGEMIREMRDVIVSSHGSWKMFLAIGGLATAMGGFATTIILRLTGH